MTESERQAFLMFAGTMHGHAKATDQMIVGQSVNLRPMSTDIQNTFAQVLQTPPQHNPYVQQEQSNEHNPYVQREQAEPIVYQQPPPDNFVGVEQAIQELAEIQPTQAFKVQPTVAVNTDIVDVLKEINLNLAKIATTLEKYGREKRAKVTKSA